MTTWLTTREFATVVGITGRAATLAVARIASGETSTWRGAHLRVRVVTGRRAAGGKAYEVELGSLPAALQERFNASKRSVQLALPLADGEGRELAWMLHYVRPIAELPSGKQRKAAIRVLDGKEVHDWNGGLVTLRRTTLYTWVKDYSEKGAAGLLRKKRADTGKPKVFVSRAWDHAVPFNDEIKQIIAAALLYRIRGIWAAGHKISKVKLFSESYLRQVTEERGFLANDLSIFELSRPRINKERHFGKVDRHKRDRKASEDSRFRIQRDTARMASMDVVMGDVHDMNAPLTLPGGKAVWPAMISFVDIATQRMRSIIVVCEKAGAVRVTDMIQAYLAMVSDQAWGLPRTLYLDNGKENVFAPFMADAVKLAWHDEDGSEHRTLIKATAHNPQAKAQVEARFALFENHYLKFLQGWAGDNRHDPKVPALGKRHAPHSAGVEAYFSEFYDLENADNNMPRQDGPLAGRSPEQRFQEFVAEGWAAAVVDERGFNVAFSERVKVQVRRNQFRRDNRFWSCDELKRHHRDAAWAYLPKYHKYNAITLEDLDGSYLGTAVPNEVLDFLDPRGAIISLQSRKLFYEGLKDLAAQAEKVDGKQLLVDYSRQHPPGPVNPPRGVVSVSRNIEPALAITPRRPTLADTKNAKEAERLEILALRQRHASGRKAG